MPRRRLLAAGVILLLGAALVAQSGPDGKTALLASGPVERRGIDYFAPDLTRHWYGTYDAPDARVEVYYVEQPLGEATSWALSSCELLRLQEDGQGAVYYLDDERWSVLILAEVADDGSFDPCPFATQFVRQFEFFQNLERSVRLAASPAFPAVVEY